MTVVGLENMRDEEVFTIDVGVASFEEGWLHVVS